MAFKKSAEKPEKSVSELPISLQQKELRINSEV